MAEDYFAQLDRYLGPQEENRFLNGGAGGAGSEGGPKLSDPIVPISQLGVTIGERGANGQVNVLQNMVAAIRQGSGLMQLTLQTDLNAAMGGGVSSIGKEQRQAMKELLQVSGAKVQGIELPTSTNNMNGFDGQRGFNEQKRRSDIRHIKDVINFNAEVGFGGGVDVLSQEFQRNMADASFHDSDTTGFIDFEGYDENRDTVKTLVDQRTGSIMQFSAAQVPTIAVPEWVKAKEHFVDHNGATVNPGDFLDDEGNKLVGDANSQQFLLERVPVWDKKKSDFKAQKMTWTEFKDYAQKRNEEELLDKSKWLSPEEWFQRVQLETQFIQQKGQSLQFSQRYAKQADELKDLVRARSEYEELEKGKSEEDLQKLGLLVPESPISGGSQFLPTKYKKKSEALQDSIEETKHSLKYSREISANADAQASGVWDSIQNITTAEKYALDKTTKSYAELGIYAMEQTKKNPDIAKPIHIGPELGWPQGYGGHPEEFIKIIQQSRKDMVQMMKDDPRYRSQYNDSQMKKLAKQHVSGMLDTAHLSMWYNHFPGKKDESEEKRLNRFNKWFVNQMDRLGEADVVGGVQVVDSMTGDHRHLPVGQGIFPTVEAVKRLQAKGFKGDVISEGHEEDSIEPGRGQYALWSSFGASMGPSAGYFGSSGGGGNAFGNIYSGLGGAAGYRAPPNYIIGAYNPSNDWNLWSETKLE